MMDCRVVIVLSAGWASVHSRGCNRLRSLRDLAGPLRGRALAPRVRGPGIRLRCLVLLELPRPLQPGGARPDGPDRVLCAGVRPSVPSVLYDGKVSLRVGLAG